jgi:DNA-binding NarL/FixJ family response regulator
MSTLQVTNIPKVHIMTGCSGRQIYLVGSNRLHNELLAFFITEKTGANCTTATALSCVPLQTQPSAQKRLVIYDFRSGCDSLEDLIASDTNNVLQSDYVALINLSSALNIECEALQCGMRGFLYYQGGVDALLKMIHSLLNAEFWVSREIMTELFLRGGISKTPAYKGRERVLTHREVEVLRGLTNGLTNAMIADSHCLSPHTVKTHISHIFKKINVANRLQAAHWASQHL